MFFIQHAREESSTYQPSKEIPDCAETLECLPQLQLNNNDRAILVTQCVKIIFDLPEIKILHKKGKLLRNIGNFYENQALLNEYLCTTIHNLRLLCILDADLDHEIPADMTNNYCMMVALLAIKIGMVDATFEDIQQFQTIHHMGSTYETFSKTLAESTKTIPEFIDHSNEEFSLFSQAIILQIIAFCGFSHIILSNIIQIFLSVRNIFDNQAITHAENVNQKVQFDAYKMIRKYTTQCSTYMLQAKTSHQMAVKSNTQDAKLLSFVCPEITRAIIPHSIFCSRKPVDPLTHDMEINQQIVKGRNRLTTDIHVSEKFINLLKNFNIVIPQLKSKPFNENLPVTHSHKRLINRLSKYKGSTLTSQSKPVKFRLTKWHKCYLCLEKIQDSDFHHQHYDPKKQRDFILRNLNSVPGVDIPIPPSSPTPDPTGSSPTPGPGPATPSTPPQRKLRKTKKPKRKIISDEDANSITIKFPIFESESEGNKDDEGFEYNEALNRWVKLGENILNIKKKKKQPLENQTGHVDLPSQPNMDKDREPQMGPPTHTHSAINPTPSPSMCLPGQCPLIHEPAPPSIYPSLPHDEIETEGETETETETERENQVD